MLLGSPATSSICSSVCNFSNGSYSLPLDSSFILLFNRVYSVSSMQITSLVHLLNKMVNARDEVIWYFRSRSPAVCDIYVQLTCIMAHYRTASLVNTDLLLKASARRKGYRYLPRRTRADFNYSFSAYLIVVCVNASTSELMYIYIIS